MAWKEVQYRLTSSAPLIMHNGRLACPTDPITKAIKQLTSKRSKTDADYEQIAHLEFIGGLYIDSDGPVIPSYVIEAALINAAKKVREGPTAKAGCYCLSHARLEYEGPRDTEELWKIEHFRFPFMVVVQRARIERMRPIFDDWSATVTLSIEDQLVNVERVDDWMQIAGTQVGLCEWRPKYGRFIAERLNSK